MITRDDLIRDRDGLTAQANQIQGALAYVNQRLALMDKEEAESNGKTKGPMLGLEPQMKGGS